MGTKINSNYLRGYCSVFALGLCLSLAGTASFAQDTSSYLDEIIVTAQKRSQSLQDVSVAVTVLSEDFMKDNVITAPQDLFQRMPNVALQQNSSAGQLQLSIRGISFATFSPIGVQPVMIFQDEVVLNSPQAAGLFIFDMERVEVLRGPQNTLYGRNTTGGAVNFISKKPVVGEEASGSADITYGRFNQIDANTAVSFPLGDKAAFRIALQSLHNDGFWENILTDERMGQRDQTVARAQIVIEPSDSFNVLLNVHGGTSKGGQRPIKAHGLLDDPVTFAPCTSPLDLDNFNTQCLTFDGNTGVADNDKVISELTNSRDDITAFGGSANLKWNTGGLEVTSITAYEQNTYDHWEDSDGLAAPFVNFRQKSDTQQWSQELRLASPADGDLRWIVGAYGFWETANFQTSIPIFGAFTNSNSVTQNNNMYSIFGQVDYDVSERVTVNGGLRFITENKNGLGQAQFTGDLSALDVNGNPDDFLFENLTADPGTFVETPFDRSWDMWGGQIGIDFQVSDDVLSYAKISRGVKAGAYSDAPEALLFNVFDQPANPEVVYAYEAGLKATLANNKLRTNLAFFYNDYEDQQLQITIADGAFLFSTVINAAKSRTYGAELEGQYAPMEDLSFDFAVGYLETEVLEASTVLAAVTGGRISIEAGRPLTNAPKWTIQGGVDKTFRVSDASDLIVHVDARFTDERTFDLIDTVETRPTVTDPSYVLVNAFVAYEFGDDSQYRLTLWGKNLTNELYFQHMQNFGIGNTIAFTSNPRQYGVTFGLDF